MFYTIINKLLKLMVTVFFNLPFIQDHSLTNQKVKETVSLYPKTGFGGLSAKIRFWDSPLEELEKYVPKQGIIVDLGCGEGILTNYLAVTSQKRNLIGVELNKDRTKFANRGLKNTQFIQGDVLKKNFPKTDVIVMSHLMHHLPSYNDQLKLIDQCFKNLKKNGELIIAEVDKQLSLKYIFAWITDALIVPILFEKQFMNVSVFYRSRSDWKTILTDGGFKIKKIEIMKHGPFSDIIIIANKN